MRTRSASVKSRIALFAVVVGLAACSEVETRVPSIEDEGGYSGPYDGDYRLEAEPSQALTDEPVRIRMSGLRPGQPVTLRATATDGAGIIWESFATFQAAEDGSVRPERQAPMSGTYEGVDPRGLFWSMRAKDALPDSAPRFGIESLTRGAITVTAEASGEVLATARLERLYPWADDSLGHDPVREHGLVGTFWHPPGADGLPAVLMLGGSSGAPQPMRAALVAARGYAVLDLVYFGTDPLPGELIEIPLEYFVQGLDWLEGQAVVEPGSVGVFGASKGAEAALLLATIDPRVVAVAAYLPSSVAWQGLSFTDWSAKSSWTHGGEPVPFVPLPVTASAVWRTLLFLMGRPVAVRSSYDIGLTDTAAVEAAAIPVERIQGEILLVSGTDDQVTASTEMSEQIVARLDERDFPHPYQHLAFEGAGHGLGTPYFPRSLSRVSSWSGDAGRLLHGGSAQQDERASAEGWAAVLELFDRSLHSDDTRLRKPSNARVGESSNRPTRVPQSAEPTVTVRPALHGLR